MEKPEKKLGQETAHVGLEILNFKFRTARSFRQVDIRRPMGGYLFDVDLVHYGGVSWV